MKLTLLTAFAFCFLNAQASHAIHSSMHCQYLGKDSVSTRYKLVFTVHASCGPSSITLPESFNYSVHNSNTSKLVLSNLLTLESSVKTDSCLSNCYLVRTYTALVTLPLNAFGYFISVNHCCREELNSLPNNQSGNPYQGIMSYVYIQGSKPVSLPQFGLKTILFSNPSKGLQKFKYELSDTSADSTSIELVAPLVGASLGDNFPKPDSVFKGFTPVAYKAGFSASMPFGLAGTLTINKSTNQIEISCPAQGFFPFSFRIKSYKNGEIQSQYDQECMLVSDNSVIQNEKIHLSLTHQIPNSALLKWNFCDLAINTIILQRSDTTETHFKTKTGILNSSSVTDNGLKAKTDYYYRLRGVNNAGDTVYSDTAHLIFWEAGTTELKRENTIKAYPNPANQIFNISSSVEEIRSWEIINHNGQIVDAAYLDQASTELNIQVSNLIGGIYFVKLELANGEVAYVKLMKW